MGFRYQSFERGLLKCAPEQQLLDGATVEYKAFKCSTLHATDKTLVPLVVLCGAFESYNLHRNLVQQMIVHQPVILVSLPGLGTNTQVSGALHFEQLVRLLKGCLDQWGLSNVCLMGSSAAASVVNRFCCDYPDQVHKAVVHGIAHRPRKSWQMLLTEALYWVDQPHWEQDAKACLLYLINEDYLEETRFHSLYKRYFAKRFATFDAVQKQQFKCLVDLLLKEDGVQGYPESDILVCTGEYDHFTLPFEHAEYADQCPNSCFALVENADHLLHFERQRETLDLFENYLLGKPIDAIAGVKVYPPQTFCSLERRTEVRYVPVQKKARLTTAHLLHPEVEDAEMLLPEFAPVTVRNINFSGCLLELDKTYYPVQAHARDMVLTLVQPQLKLEILAFEQCEHTMRCVFKHHDYQAALALKDLLENEAYFRLPNAGKIQSSRQDPDAYDDLLVGY